MKTSLKSPERIQLVNPRSGAQPPDRRMTWATIGAGCRNNILKLRFIWIVVVILSLGSFSIQAEVINVKTYGAIGDGLTDDTIAIKTAINNLNSNGGDVLHFPCGGYKISDSLSVPSGTMVLGSGVSASIIFNTSSFGPIFKFTGDVTGLYFSSLQLFTTGSSAFKQEGGTMRDCYFEDVYFQSCSPSTEGGAFLASDLRYCTFIKCLFVGLNANSFGVVGKMDHVAVVESSFYGRYGVYLDVPGWGNSLFLANYCNYNYGGVFHIVNGQDITVRGVTTEGLHLGEPGVSIWIEEGCRRIALERIQLSYSASGGENHPTGKIWLEGTDIYMNGMLEGAVVQGQPEPIPALKISGDRIYLRNSMISIPQEEGVPEQRVYQTCLSEVSMPLSVRHGTNLENWATNPALSNGETLKHFKPFDMQIPSPPIFGYDKAKLDGLNVKDFGAIGDGITDDTSAIQSALYALKDFTPITFWLGGSFATVTRTTLYFPAGTYRITAPLDLNRTTAVTIIGDGIGETIITGDSNYNDALFSVGDTGVEYWLHSAKFEDLTMRNGKTSIHQTPNYTITNAYQMLKHTFFQRVALENFSEAGLRVHSLMQGSAFIDCSFKNSTRGVWLGEGDLADWSVTDKVTWLRCEFSNLSNDGFVLVGSPARMFMGEHTLRDCTFTQIQGHALRIDGCFFNLIDHCQINNAGLSGVPAVYLANTVYPSGSTVNDIEVNNTLPGANYLLYLESTWISLDNIVLRGRTTTGKSMYVASYAVVDFDGVRADEGLLEGAWVNYYWEAADWKIWKVYKNCRFNEASGSITGDVFRLKYNNTNVDFADYGYIPVNESFDYGSWKLDLSRNIIDNAPLTEVYNSNKTLEAPQYLLSEDGSIIVVDSAGNLTDKPVEVAKYSHADTQYPVIIFGASSPGTSGRFRLEWDAVITERDPDQNNKAMSMRVYGSGGALLFSITYSFLGYLRGDFVADGGGGLGAIPYTDGQKQHFVVDLDLDVQRVNITVDGAPLIVNGTYANAGSGFQGLMFRDSTGLGPIGTFKGAIDNIMITKTRWSADFGSDIVGTAPVTMPDDPGIILTAPQYVVAGGDGSIIVVDSAGNLTDKPVEVAKYSHADTQCPAIIFGASSPWTSGRFHLEWDAVITERDPDQNNKAMSMRVYGSGGALLFSITYSFYGYLMGDFVTDGGGGLGAILYTDGQKQHFVVDLDLDIQRVNITVDGAPLIVNGTYANAGSGFQGLMFWDSTGLGPIGTFKGAIDNIMITKTRWSADFSSDIVGTAPVTMPDDPGIILTAPQYVAGGDGEVIVKESAGDLYNRVIALGKHSHEDTQYPAIIFGASSQWTSGRFRLEWDAVITERDPDQNNKVIKAMSMRVCGSGGALLFSITYSFYGYLMGDFVTDGGGGLGAIPFTDGRKQHFVVDLDLDIQRVNITVDGAPLIVNGTYANAGSGFQGLMFRDSAGLGPIGTFKGAINNVIIYNVDNIHPYGI